MSEETIGTEQHNELLFMQLVMMFQDMVMQQLGKVANPATQQVEQDLGQAKNFIDLLAMIEARTSGNLNDREKQLLDHALFELRMNFVDETKKAASESSADEARAPEESAPEEGAPEEGGSDEEGAGGQGGTEEEAGDAKGDESDSGTASE